MKTSKSTSVQIKTVFIEGTWYDASQWVNSNNLQDCLIQFGSYSSGYTPVLLRLSKDQIKTLGLGD